MIKGKSKTEKEYRAIEIDSSSSLKDFATDRRKYYRKYILKEKIEEKDNFASNMGRIVETLLFEPEEMENRFIMSECTSVPTGLMLSFVEALYKYTVRAIDEDGVITKSFEEISKDAYNESGFKITYEAVIGKFIGSEAETYYNEIKKVRLLGLTVITSKDITIAENIVNELKSNSITSEIVNLKDSVRYQVMKQFQVEEFEINDLKLKGMLDLVIVDHSKKIIYPYDLKCVWAVEDFYKEYYLYRRAYIQAFLYKQSITSLTKDVNSEFYGYTVENLQFIVCDSGNYYSPLIYKMTEEDMKDAYEGFFHRDKFYIGVKEIIEELKFAKQNDIWNISKKSYLSNGILKIKDGKTK